MTEIKGGIGGRPKPAQGREDGWRGRGPPTSPQAGKKRVDGPGFKGPAPGFRGTPTSPRPAVFVSKSEGKGKASSSSSTKTITKTTRKTTSVRARAEKKVYTLPGQKYDPPEEREPLRIFYESLSKQIPSSEMAEFWIFSLDQPAELQNLFDACPCHNYGEEELLLREGT